VRDRVHQVDLIARNGVETAVPALVTVRPGDHVSFRSADGFLHLVRFVADSLDGEGRAWLDAMRVESPPLLDRGARWVVGFERAPSGRYSYTLEGNLRPGRGVVVVDAQSRF
jgi:plastocyanin